jgi:sugar/nucleoside kinase (ribokinase family)
VTAAAGAPIAAFGDVCLHVTVRPDGHGEFSVGDVELGPGGSCAMVALQVAALDRPVTMFGVAGDDDLADRLRARLTAAGIDCSRWESIGGATARVVITVDTSGGHRLVVDQGGVTEPGEALAGAAREAALPDDALCYVPGFPGYDAVRGVLAERGARLVCDFGFRPWLTDPDTARKNILPRMGGVTVAVCSGASFVDADNIALARACVDSGATAVITSLGPRGCLVTDPGGTQPVPAFVTEPVNTLGAGDALVAGVLVGLADGSSVLEACVLGQAVAARKITSLDGFADLHGVRALLDSMR